MHKLLTILVKRMKNCQGRKIEKKIEVLRSYDTKYDKLQME